MDAIILPGLFLQFLPRETKQQTYVYAREKKIINRWVRTEESGKDPLARKK